MAKTQIDADLSPRHGQQMVHPADKERITCELLAHSDSIHLQQIYTGFQMLHESGAIELSQKIVHENVYDDSKPQHLKDARLYHLKVLVNKEIVAYYDAHDGPEINVQQLNQSDFYFKRSFSRAVVRSLPDGHKVFPFGLNYPVYSARPDRFLTARMALYKRPREKFEVYLRGRKLNRFLFGRVYAPRVDNSHFPPDFAAPPRVLFMTQTWDPAMAREPRARWDIESINETRAQCIRLLRKEFGKQFMGGFSHGEYANKHYSDCLLANNLLSRKRAYSQLLREFPICVATTGLLGSNGWKLGEYVATSKAIVTQPLKYEVPGVFRVKTNYLEFTSPFECVEAASELFENQKLRREVMLNNFRYYQSFLRPDALILNTLATALDHS